jgi:3-oxoadipate enol-lactonase
VSRHQRLFESVDPEGYTACAAAVCDVDTLSRLHQIRMPTLVITSQQDESTPQAMAEALHRGISGSRLEVLPDCAHLSACEQPEAFAELVGDFIASL